MSWSCLQNGKLMKFKFLTLENANVFNNIEIFFYSHNFFVLNNYMNLWKLLHKLKWDDNRIQRIFAYYMCKMRRISKLKWNNKRIQRKNFYAFYICEMRRISTYLCKYVTLSLDKDTGKMKSLILSTNGPYSRIKCGRNLGIKQFSSRKQKKSI